MKENDSTTTSAQSKLLALHAGECVERISLVDYIKKHAKISEDVSDQDIDIAIFHVLAKDLDEFRAEGFLEGFVTDLPEAMCERVLLLMYSVSGSPWKPVGFASKHRNFFREFPEKPMNIGGAVLFGFFAYDLSTGSKVAVLVLLSLLRLMTEDSLKRRNSLISLQANDKGVFSRAYYWEQLNQQFISLQEYEELELKQFENKDAEMLKKLSQVFVRTLVAVKRKYELDGVGEGRVPATSRNIMDPMGRNVFAEDRSTSR
jgi:hypothetical protein